MRLLALLLALLLGVCAAHHQYAIYVRGSMTPAQAGALGTMAGLAGPNKTLPDSNSVWHTTEALDSPYQLDALLEALFGGDGPGALHVPSRRRAVDTGRARVIVDTVKPVHKTAVASWGLDRVDQRALPLDNSYQPDRTGAGATLWIVDTGIDASHPDFGGRAQNVFATYDPLADCDGHGTHVAGIAAGASFGVARQAALRGVKVLDCTGSGTTGTVALGLQHVLNYRAPGRNVVNLSLGYSVRDYVVEALLDDLYSVGVTIVAAAGNENKPACQHFPGAHTTVISVASTAQNDARSSFSNYGTCVDLFAPGSAIVSARLDGGSTTMSGTSMSSPHVAGAAALVLQPVQQGPAAVRSELLAAATAGVVTGVNGSPNLLLYVLRDQQPPQPSPVPQPSPLPSSAPNAAAATGWSCAVAAAVVAAVWACA